MALLSIRHICFDPRSIYNYKRTSSSGSLAHTTRTRMRAVPASPPSRSTSLRVWGGGGKLKNIIFSSGHFQHRKMKPLFTSAAQPIFGNQKGKNYNKVQIDMMIIKIIHKYVHKSTVTFNHTVILTIFFLMFLNKILIGIYFPCMFGLAKLQNKLGKQKSKF